MSFVRATLKSESWSQFFGLQSKTGVKIQHFDPNTIQGKMTAKFYDVKNERGKRLVGPGKMNDIREAEKQMVYEELSARFKKRLYQNLEEDPEQQSVDENPAENQSIQNFSFKITNPPEKEFSTDPKSGNTSLLIQSIEGLNEKNTTQGKELKVKSQNWSEFFGLKTKTGVTTRMFGSNTTWGKITALFCLDSTNTVKRMIEDELQKQDSEKTHLLEDSELKEKLNGNNPSDSLKEKLNNTDQNGKLPPLTPLTPAAVMNFVKSKNKGLDEKVPAPNR